MDENMIQDINAEKNKEIVAKPSKGETNWVPPGTYPKGLQPPKNQPENVDIPAVMAKMEKSRWIGTITMAVSLIVFGMLMALWVILPSFDIAFYARFTPLVLVMLGVEILVATMRNKGERLRINVLTVFMCLVLLASSVAAVVLPQAVTNYREARLHANEMQKQLDEATYNELMNNKGLQISNVEWYVGTYDIWDSLAYEDPSNLLYIQARVFFSSEYENKEDFARDCHTVVTEIKKHAPHIDYVGLYSWDEESNRVNPEKQYTLWLHNQWYMDDSVDEMLANVRTEYLHPDYGYYVSEGEWEDYLEMKEEAENLPKDESYDEV